MLCSWKWFKFSQMEFESCERCGRLRNPKTENRPCRGHVKIGLRNTQR